MGNNLSLTAKLDTLKSNQTKLLEYANSEPKIYPDTAVGVTVTAAGGGTFARGAYSQIVAAAGIATKFRITAIVVQNVSAADEWEIDLAAGTAASEVDFATFKFVGDGRVEISSIADVAAGARLAARIGCLDAVARTAKITVEYIDSLT